MSSKKSKTNKLKVGSLVLVQTRTRGDFYVSNTYAWNGPLTSTSMNTYSVPSVMTDQQVYGLGNGPYSISSAGGAKTQANTVQRPHDKNVKYGDIVADTSLSDEEVESLNALYQVYLNSGNGSSNSGGNTLGMVVWNGPPPVGSGSYTTNYPSLKNASNWIIQSGQGVPISSNYGYVEDSYYAHGYKEIGDYFMSNARLVKQDENFTEEELEKYTKNGELYLTYGKPMKGIIVDMFSYDSVRTANGEKVDMGLARMPTMYKILVGVKDCLWFAETDVSAMDKEGTK